MLSVTHMHVYQEPLPTNALAFEGTAYNLCPDESRANTDLESPVIPSLDHALYLTDTVSFRCGQIYHVFDRPEFLSSLHIFYSKDKARTTSSVWYIQLLLVLALGNAFCQIKSKQDAPPGIQYFTKAMHLLPDHNQLYSHPIISTEILCCIAIFYQSLDCRSAAHNYVWISHSYKCWNDLSRHIGLTQLSDRPSYADGNESRHAHLYAHEGAGGTCCREVPQDLVDCLQP